MNLKKVMVALDISDVQEILRIDMDEDPQEALAFVKDRLVRQVKLSLQPH